MPSYKIHSIKNNKKLSFIIEGESSEKVKQSLSTDGYIVITIDDFIEEENQIPRFIFEAFKDDRSKIEGKIDAKDIFSAFELLKNDYQYTVTKLYPVNVIDHEEQDSILKNIFLLYPENKKIHKEVVKNKTLIDIDVFKKYLDILEVFVKKSSIKNTETLLYDIKRVRMINSVSSAEEVIKKVIKTVYNKGSVEEKKDMYKSIFPIANRVGVFIFPPLFFSFIATVENTFLILKILFQTPEKKHIKIQDKKISFFTSFWKSFFQKNDTSEKNMFGNKNIFILLKMRYRSSFFDIFKSEGRYFYSLFRQYKLLFWLKRTQEYISILALYTLFLFIFGIILVGSVFSPEFLFFNKYISLLMSIVFVSLVIFPKEI